MSFDGIVVRSVVHELQPCAGGRIHKIQQPSEHDIVLHIRAQGQTYRLLLSANPTYPRIHLTTETFVNPMEAPMFCMLMRKHCEGGLLEAIEQDGMERVIRLQLKQRDELGDVSGKSIVLELMGRHSNILLLDTASNTIVDGIHHVTPAISSHRIVMPGTPYTPPPEQAKLDPLMTARQSFIDELQAAPEQPQQMTLVQRFTGLSPLVAAELVHRAHAGQADSATASQAVDPDRLWASFAAVMQDVREHLYRPNIVELGRTGRSFFSVIELTHLIGETMTYPSPSACLEAYYADKAQRDTVRQRTSDLQRFLHNELNKTRKKLDKLAETMEDAHEADRFRITGELLTASLHLAAKGDKSVEVTNYYDEQQGRIAIELDPLLTPAENAQRYFRKYTKAKTSLTFLAEQMREAEDNIRYFETVLQQLQDATLADIEEIRDELAEQGFIRNRAKRGAKKKKPGVPALSGYISSEGVPILVGKNNTQNEYLTCRLAQPQDTWLHTKDIPGSHVVIRGTGFSEATLQEAAQLAGYFSQAKASSGVPVDYTQVRHVRKPNGAKPGFVIYDHQKTLYVTPDEQLVKSMKLQPR